MRSAALVVVSSVFVPLATVFVALRFKARKSTKAGPGLDDYTILAALIIQYAGFAITMFGAIAGGWGDSGLNLSEHSSETATYAKVLFFPHGFSASILMGEIFSSRPVSKGPDDPDGPFVIDYAGFLLSMAAINIVLDVITVFMPLSVIRALQMSSVRKAQVSGIFLLGLFCIIAAAARVYYLGVISHAADGPGTESQLDEISRVAVSVTMWFIIESQTSIIAACLPTLAPLFRSSQYAGFKVQMRRPMPVLRPIRLRGTTKSSKVDSTHIEQGSKDDRRPWEHMNSDSSHEGDVASDSNAELTVVDIV
ncbi:MAG: hypothetical protein ALECFALPRED_007138 [Alectoria fallacina]|uniref:Rhodopsin domain-containing protein n=1 Tax=Alectoria fallacina TaxID=1903189 RepID=A0A8H3G7C4_9LECA|nr:MAG: hypothetical protein ALECFALPRED_007138 [Alectoria fallacina]